MSAAAPWSVKGIDPKAREVAKDLARRSGMTLGEWLNTMIMDDEDDGALASSRRASPEVSDRSDRNDRRDIRSRSRRLDDDYGYRSSAERRAQDIRAQEFDEEMLRRVAASVEAIAERLEAAEQRSTVAIQGVDQAVTGLVRRMDGQDAQSRTNLRRIDDIAEELREGHRRLRAFEHQIGPQTTESFGKMETSVAAIAARLYDIEERQRGGVNELRQRMETVEKTAMPGAGTELLSQVGARLDQAQARTGEALRALEQSFAGLDQRLRAAEGRVEPEGVREAARFEKLAETLSRQVDANRSEMMRRLDTAEAEGRMDRIERAFRTIGEQAKAAEERSAQAVDAMGREVLRIAQNLNTRVETVETEAAKLGSVEGLEQAIGDRLSASLTADLNQAMTNKVERDMGRYAQAIDHRLQRADDQNALALERLGGEITRISDRLADRIAQSERKSAQAIEDIGRRLTDTSDRIEHRAERATGELAERQRLSEERTLRLLAEARDTIESRLDRTERPAPIAEPVMAPVAAAVAAPLEIDQAAPVQGNWRAAAFQDEGFSTDFAAADFSSDDDGWAGDPLSADVEPAAFPNMFADAAPEPVQAVVREDVYAARTSQSAPPVQVVFPPVMAEAEHEPEPEPVYAASAHEVDADRIVEPFGAAPMSVITGDREAHSDTARAGHPALTPAALSSDLVSNLAPDLNGEDAFDANSDFVDAQALRAALDAGAAAGRTADNRITDTRNALDAARAAMRSGDDSDGPEDGRAKFGLKRGGKSRLQERLDKQAARDGSTMRKAVLASVTGMAVVGGLYTTARLAGADSFALPGMEQINSGLERLMGSGEQPDAKAGGQTGAKTEAPLAAVALTPTGVGPATADPAAQAGAKVSQAEALFDQAVAQLDAGQAGGVAALTQAANLGSATAQLKLAGLYETGEAGVARDPAQSRQWARRAAEGNDARGMHAYGMYLFDGVGGPRNRPEALTWLTKAADRGLVDSQYNVARIYENGDEGIAPNPTEAFKWYLVAARAGDQQAKGSVDRLTPLTSATVRRAARVSAEAFQAAG